MKAEHLVPISSESPHRGPADEASPTNHEDAHLENIPYAPRVEALPRRPFLGLHVHADVERRVVVVKPLEGSAASAASVRPGDGLLAIDGIPVLDAGDVIAAARRHRVGDEVVFTVERNGRTLDLAGRASALPSENGTTLGTLGVRGHRLRTVLNVPEGPGPHPALLYLQGIRPHTCEHPFDPDAPLRRFAEHFADAGVLVMRVERSGVGDSEGPSCATTDLGFELDTYRAALDHLRTLTDRVWLFGHSLGGMVAPLLARQPTIAGVAVFGTSALRWLDCVVGTTRRQLRLEGLPDAEADRWAELHTLVCREGWTPERAFEQRPHLRSLRSSDCTGETYAGRHVSLFQQLDAIDLLAAWRDVHVPVLAVHGEYDWICTREESETLAHAARGSCVELAKIGHDWLAYDDFEQSRRPGNGRRTDAVARAVEGLLEFA